MRCLQCQLKCLSRRPVSKIFQLQYTPPVTWERPASAVNYREHLDVLESTGVSAVSTDVFDVKTSRRLGSRQYQASEDCFLFFVVICELVPASS